MPRTTAHRTTARPGAHIRGNRISGDTTHLNENAIKVLAAIKFSPSSVSREEIMQKSNLPREDVERQVALLLTYQLVMPNVMFPAYPQQGYKVYTSPQKHTQIVQILRDAGFQDEASQRTREGLEDYYPTGMALEGTGRQENHNRSYPPIVPVNEDLEYKEETMALMKTWRDEQKPFKPKEFSPEAVETKKKKFQWLLDRLAVIYGIQKPRLIIGDMTAESWTKQLSSGSSNYSPTTNTITINGKFSVITLLHEFGHARGFDETDTTLWSINLFKRIFPISYSRLQGEGHCLIQPNRETPFESSGEGE